MSSFIVTAGGTSEPIDTVRSIKNTSSGQTGKRIAEEILSQTDIPVDTLYYIAQAQALAPNPDPRLVCIEIESTGDALTAIETILKREKITYFIHTMAVADYTVDGVWNTQNIYNDIQGFPAKPISANKINSGQDGLYIKLKPTPKIIDRIKMLQPDIFLVGFKLLNHADTEHLIARAVQLAQRAGADLIVANDLSKIDNDQGLHLAHLVHPDGTYKSVEGKQAIAEMIINILNKVAPELAA